MPVAETGNDMQNNALSPRETDREVTVVANAKAFSSEKTRLFDEMVKVLSHRDVVEWYEDNVHGMLLGEIEHMQGKVYPCIAFDAQGILDEVQKMFGDQISISVKKTGWSGIEEIDVSLTGKNILSEDLNWFFNKIERIPLGSLQFTDCERIQEIDLSKLPKLKSVSFDRCRALETMKGLNGSRDLMRFAVVNCNKLKTIEKIDECRSLKSIDMNGARLLQNFPDLSGLTELESLTLRECCSMDAIPGLSNLTNLEYIKIDTLDYGFVRIPDLSNLTKLQCLCIKDVDTEKGIYIPGLLKLTKLKVLSIVDSVTLTNADELSQLRCLECLTVYDAVECEGISLSLLDHPNLKYLDIFAASKGFDISGATNLESLKLQSSDVVIDLSNMVKLKEVKLDYTENEDNESGLFYDGIIISKECPFAKKAEAQEKPFVFADEM